jgi:hypothetical protein
VKDEKVVQCRQRAFVNRLVHIVLSPECESLMPETECTEGDCTVKERKSAFVLQENAYRTDASQRHAELGDLKARKIISKITKGKHCRG